MGFMLFWGMILPLSALAKEVTPSPNKPKQENVFVGFHINKVVNVDLKLNTYWVDFYIWFRWKGNIDPTASYEFMNGFEKWGETSVAENENVRILKGGWKYKEIHTELQFHSPFHFGAYPMDQQILTLKVEDKSHPLHELKYIADHANSSYDEDIFIPGWKIDNFDISAKDHKYKTNFGQPGVKKETYSQLTYSLQISRHPRTLFLFKLFLPAAIILVMVFLIYFIPISFFEARVEISITGLLSLIALQMVLNDELPPVGYLTLTDKVYYFTYFLVMCGLIQTVVVYFSFKRDAKLARRIDKASAFFMLMLTPVVLGFLFTVFK